MIWLPMAEYYFGDGVFYVLSGLASKVQHGHSPYTPMMEDTSSLGSHHVAEVYKPTSISSEGGGVVQKIATDGSRDRHMHSSSGSGASASGEAAKSRHRMDGRDGGSSSDRSHNWNQNELQEAANPQNGNFAASASGSPGDHSRAMHLPLQSSPDKQESAATAYTQTPPEAVSTAKGFEGKPVSKLHPVATPPNEGGAVPVIVGSNEPTALSSFNRRHMAETYSSDDDDVFLPDPPSKSQADRCIVAMDTGEEEKGEVSLRAPQIVVTPDGEEEKQERGEEEEPKEVLDDSATTGKFVKFKDFNFGS